MVDPDTASVKIVQVPRLSIARLLDLRAFLDSVLPNLNSYQEWRSSKCLICRGAEGRFLLFVQ
jgi:hypothetical protein